MPDKSALIWEFLRKAVHMTGLLIVVGYTLLLNYLPYKVAILAMTGLLLIFLEIEYIRVEHRPKIVEMFDCMFRRREKDHVSSAVFLVISCIISFAAFDYWVGVLALFMTVLGDLFAALVGKTFGKTVLYRGKTIVGTMAGFAANMAAGFLILPNFPLVFIPMAVVATFTELITNKLDDNLTVPIFAGFIGQMLVYYYALTLPPIDFTFLGLF